MAGIFWSMVRFVVLKNTQRSVFILDAKDQFRLSMISFFFLIFSSSGASVVAIDNKIEQAMVRTD